MTFKLQIWRDARQRVSKDAGRVWAAHHFPTAGARMVRWNILHPLYFFDYSTVKYV